MWNLSVNWLELIVRGIIVYIFLIIILRMTGKRQIGQMAPFDLVLLLVLSNSVQNAINGGDNSVLGGFISAATLIGINWSVALITFRSKTMEALIEGRPRVLIHNGKLFEDVMKRERLTHHELNASLREAGCSCVEEVHYAMIENNGQISILPKKEHEGNGVKSEEVNSK
jgi:uncharacterized membrane protein YcaP (DUF421 family)